MYTGSTCWSKCREPCGLCHAGARAFAVVTCGSSSVFVLLTLIRFQLEISLHTCKLVHGAAATATDMFVQRSCGKMQLI